MKPTRYFVGLLLAVAITIGCGTSFDGRLAPSPPPPGEDPLPAREVTLETLYATALPEHVSRIAVRSFSSDGQQLQESSYDVPAPASVSVPIQTASLEIDYFADRDRVGFVAFDLPTAGPSEFSLPTDGLSTYGLLKLDILINADYWEREPRMIAGGLGFTDIIGIEGLDLDDLQTSEQLVRAAGGAWNTIDCEATSMAAYTSAVTPQQVANTYGVPVVNGDGLPVEFSWPVRPSTVDPTDFSILLNDGTRVTPEASSITPNYDFNERSTVVLFGQFGNRLGPDDPDALYPVRVEVVEDETPLQLVGPGVTFVSAVGFAADSPGTPYTDPDVAPEDRGGPRLVGGKLSRLSAVGDSAPIFVGGPFTLNDGITLYGPQAQYRVRVLTSGGFSPDGVEGMKPDEYSRYFRLQARNEAGDLILLEEAGVDYDIDGATVQVLGLAELGVPQDSYDACYRVDSDNQIDIILAGDLEAVRKIVAVEVPSVAPYSPVYNPGGPGNDPTPGVRYSAPSAPHTQPIADFLDDPGTVTYIDLRGLRP